MALEAAASLIYDKTLIFPFDVLCLEKGELINNAIIDFYLKYLYRERLNHDQRQRIQIFESVFLNGLASKIGNSSTNQLQLLEKDFFIMPARLEEHWFLLVVCYARNVLSDNFDREQKPEILLFDSAKNYLSTKRSTFLRLFRSFIQSEFAKLLNESLDTIGSLTKKLPLVMVPTQQQDNDVDCGVFLMENVERFLIDKFELPAGRTVTMAADPDCFIDIIEMKRESIKNLIETLAGKTVAHFFD